jgi:hypothetical protein
VRSFSRGENQKNHPFAAGEIGVDGYLAQQKFTGAHVRFGSKADIEGV